MNLTHSYSALKMYDNCPYRYYRQRVLKDVVDEGGEASKYGERIHKYLEDRLAVAAELPREISRYEVLCQAIEKAATGGQLLVEQELCLNEELSPTGWWEPDAWLRSKLDILILKGADATVMDWKTGKRWPDFFQMEIFAAQVFKHYPEVQRVKTSLVWLKDMALDTEQYTRLDMNGLWAEIMKKIRRVYQSAEHDNWPARPSGLCRYCPARHDCDSARF